MELDKISRARLDVAEEDSLVLEVGLTDDTTLPSLVVSYDEETVTVFQTDDHRDDIVFILLRWDQVEHLRVLGHWESLYRSPQYPYHYDRIARSYEMDPADIPTETLQQWIARMLVLSTK